MEFPVDLTKNFISVVISGCKIFTKVKLEINIVPIFKY